MSLSKKYLNLNESAINEELPKKLEVALERLEKKPAQKQAEMAMSLLKDLIGKVAETAQGVRLLKEFAPTAYDTVVRGAEGEEETDGDEEVPASSTGSVSEKDIIEWLEKAKASIEKQTAGGVEGNKTTIGWKKGPKYFQVWTERPSVSSSRSAYCFIDMEGNIYKSAGWGKVAKGIRGHITKSDPNKADPYTGWLYR